MLGVIYPLMMKEVGMSYFAIASLASVYNLSAASCRPSYGFIVPYLPRGVILGIGNCLLRTLGRRHGFRIDVQSFFHRALDWRHRLESAASGWIELACQPFCRRPWPRLGVSIDRRTDRRTFSAAVSRAVGHLFGWRGVFWFIGALTIIVGLICFVFRDSLRERDARANRNRASRRPAGKPIKPA